MRCKLLLAAFAALLWGAAAFGQASYIVEQIGRDEHQIVQSLGAFVGIDGAESRAFDITFMPAGNGVEGVMVVTTADFRATFKMAQRSSECFEILVEVRSADFLRDFNRLFQTYPTQGSDALRTMDFGNQKLRIAETSLPNARHRSFRITEAE